MSTRRTFQALRIAVNDEFSALDALLREESVPGEISRRRPRGAQDRIDVRTDSRSDSVGVAR
jgi:hypothetical protein